MLTLRRYRNLMTVYMDKYWVCKGCQRLKRRCKCDKEDDLGEAGGKVEE